MPNFWPTQWEHPDVLWGLAVLPLVAYLLWHDGWLKRRTMQQWSQVTHVIRHSSGPSLWTEGRRAALILSSFTFAVLGFASPTLPTVVWEPVWERVAVGLLLDVSRSMRAPVNPYEPSGLSRLETLQQAVQEMIEQLPGGARIGVIAFAGLAVPIVPEPSVDHQAVLAKIRRLDAAFIRNPGTALAAAIQQGLALFVDTAPEAQPATVSLILLSDGDTVVTQDLRTTLQHAALPIYTLGIGALQSARIPEAQSPEGFLLNRRGRPVTTAVNESVLRFVAEQTGGLYYPFTARGTFLDALQQIVAQQSQQVMQPVPRPRSARQLLFLAAFCCLLLYQFQTRTRFKG